jgi:hypothetical protein
MPPFGGGVEVGVYDGEAGSLQRAPASAGGALLDFDWSDCSFRTVVREGHSEIDREAQDHVFVAGESSDQGAGFGCEVTGLAAVVGGAFRDRAEVVVPDLFEGNGIEPVGAGGTGVVCGLVGVQQCAGHRQRPDLALGVTVGYRPQIPEQMRPAPGVDGGQMRIAVPHQGAGELR